MKTLNGSCLCGAVKFQVPDDFDFMGNCHCSECRKFSGSDYASVGSLQSAKFRYVDGEDQVSVYRKSEETELHFCKNCGSSLFSRKLTGGRHNIRLGVLDQAPSHKPSFHIFVGSKAPWLEICDELPQFETRPQ